MARPGRPKVVMEAVSQLAELISAEKHRAHDERLATQLGRLLRHKEISSAQFLAGESFARVVSDVRRLTGMPRGLPKPNRFQHSPGGEAPDFPEEDVREAVETYRSVHLAVVGKHGHRGVQVAYDCCVDNCFTQWSDMNLLKDVLTTIGLSMDIRTK